MAWICLQLLLLAVLLAYANSWRSFMHMKISKNHASMDSKVVSSKDVASSAVMKTFSSLSVLASAASVFMLDKNDANSMAMAAATEDATKKKKKVKVLETEDGIKYIEVKKGTGVYPGPGDFVVISYNAFLSNGTLFDSTEGKGRKPLSFRFGKKQVIPGIESVLYYMQPGGEVTCTIPSKFAYGSKGVCIANEGCLVPPNEDLRYAIKLISVGAGYN